MYELITPPLLASAYFWHFRLSLFTALNHIIWLRISDEGSVTEMRILSILLIKSDLKWCILQVEVSFLNFNYLVSVTAVVPDSLTGHIKQSYSVDFG